MKYLYLIFRLFFTPGCRHKFEVLDQYKLSIQGRQYGTVYVSKCKFCGKIVDKQVS